MRFRAIANSQKIAKQRTKLMAHNNNHGDCACCANTTKEDQKKNIDPCCTSEELPRHQIKKGTVLRIDIAHDVLNFDEILSNEGEIVIFSSDPNLENAKLTALHIENEGQIISSVPNLEIYTETLGGHGLIRAPERISVISNRKNLAVKDGTFESKWFEGVCSGILRVHAHRIDGEIEVTANSVAVGVRTGTLTIGKQTLVDDPIYYNKGGNCVITSPPTSGADIYGVASGNVTCGSLDASQGDNTWHGRIYLVSGYSFANTGPDTTDIFACNDCALDFQTDSLFESDGVPGPLSGTVSVTGNLSAKSIVLTGGNVEVTGNIHAVAVPTPFGQHGGAIVITAEDSITITGTITADDDENDPEIYPGNVGLNAPVVEVTGVITSGKVNIGTTNYSETDEGSITTNDIVARREVVINAGNVQLSGGGSLSEKNFSSLIQGDFTIETGDIDAVDYILLLGTNSIVTGAVTLHETQAENVYDPHNIIIHANVEKETGAAEFKVGTGGSNGPSSITIEGVKDTFGTKAGAIFISNGPVGDIAIDGEAITISREQEGTPNFVAHAGDGKITITNSLNVDGTSSIAAGAIALMANEISIGETTSITANSTVEEAESFSPVIIFAANTITLDANLTVECKGNFFTAVRFAPKDSLDMKPLETPATSDIRPQYASFFPADDSLTFTGDGNVVVNVESDSGAIEIGGTLIEMDAGTVELNAFGDFSAVNFTYQGSAAGTDSLVMSGGKVTITAGNPSGDGGYISIQTDQINLATELELNVNSDAGNGGSISISTTAGSFTTVSEIGQISAFAKGLAGGTISIITDGSMTLAGEVDVSANDSGNAGTVTLTSGESADFSEFAMNANGGSTGTGGNVNIEVANESTLSILSIAAIGGVEAGGNISITSVAAADLDVNLLESLLTSDSEEEFTGSLTLTVNDSSSNNISLSISEDADFSTILTATGKSVSVTSLSDIRLGLAAVEAVDGDIEMCVDGSGTCAVAVANIVKKQSFAEASSLIKKVAEGEVLASKVLRFSASEVHNEGQISALEELEISTTKLVNNGAVTCRNGQAKLYPLDVSEFEKGLEIFGDGLVASEATMIAAVQIGRVNTFVPTHISIHGTQELKTPNNSESSIAISAGLEPQITSDPSSISFYSGTLTLTSQIAEIFSPIVNISETIDFAAADCTVSFLTFKFNNAATLIFKNAIFLNAGQQTHSEGGSITADNILIGGAGTAESLTPGLSVIISDQNYTANDEIIISANDFVVESICTLTAESRVTVSTTTWRNDGKIVSSSELIYIQDSVLSGNLTVSGTTGELESEVVEIHTAREADISQRKIFGIIVGSFTGGSSSITTTDDEMNIGEIEALGSISIISDGPSLNLDSGGAGLVAQFGNVLLWNKNPGGNLLFKANTEVRATGLGSGPSVKAYIGALPSSVPAGTAPPSVLLLNNAVTGTNVFFGSGITGSGANVIDIDPAGSVEFNGPSQLLGGVIIRLS
jgi:hypothetical protein